MRNIFSVTYEIVTAESAAEGDAEERGFEMEYATLREAISAVTSTRTSRVGGVESVECNTSDRNAIRWVTVTNGMEYETGAQESRSLHIPDCVTPSSARRIARYVGARV